MKKLVFFVAVFGALILGLTSNVKAQTITFYCILDISDTCNGGGYHGYYDVTVELWTSGDCSPDMHWYRYNHSWNALRCF